MSINRGERVPSTPRHESHCSVCKHEQKGEIEAELRAGFACNHVEKKYSLPRNSAGRHKKFFGLELDLVASSKVIVAAGLAALSSRPPTPAHINDALKTIAKLEGRWVDRTQQLPMGWENKTEADYRFFSAHGRFPHDDEQEETLQ